MPLAAGTHLGPYVVQSLLGAGGMGEVYRATDTRLNRDVALKILPDAFAQDAERLARFQREAQVLASLNHPNIGAIHGIEEGPAEAGRHVLALVLELVDGPTLADRIAQGPLPIDEALAIARQIAEALEAAHERGVVHRDLKPANVKLTAAGQVKVLDFGLAKMLEREPAPGPTSMSPTLSMQATYAGVILGTAAYMSPEQARGQAVDQRADIWAFGCVLLEMLTGRKAFDAGDTVSDAIAAILRGEPDWDALPPATPLYIRTLVRRCLQKDPKKRLPHVGVARLEIEEGGPSAAPQAPPPVAAPGGASRRHLLVLSAAAATLGVAAVLAVLWLTRLPQELPPPVRFQIVLQSTEPFAMNGFYRNVAISPDGRTIAYIVSTAAGAQLMVRPIDQLESTPIRGATTAGSPFFSPDGQWIGYFTGAAGELKKVSVTGGAPVTLCRYQGNARGASWAEDGTIVFATSDGSTGLMSVPAAGGDPKVLTTADAASGEADHYFPSVLPGGRAVLYTATSSTGGPDAAHIAVLDLASGARTTLVRGGGDAKYVVTGHLLYGVSGSLRAVGFDAPRLAVTTEPIPVADRVQTFGTAAALFDVSRQGTLVLVPGNAAAGVARPLVWMDRRGREEDLGAPPRQYAQARLSPDGARVALEIGDADNDIWVWDLARRTLGRLTFDPASDENPVWAPDGRRIAFSSSRNGGVHNIYWQAADGTGSVERLTTSPDPHRPTAFSGDGKSIIMTGRNPEVGTDNLLLLTLDGERKGTVLAPSRFNESNGALSPDGRWIAYQSTESGTTEVYVRPFPNVNDGRWQISSGGGTRPTWTRGGREIIYVVTGAPIESIMAVPVDTGLAFRAGNAVKLFDGEFAIGVGRTYDVTPNGERFLMLKDPAAGQAGASTLTVVVGWAEELKRLMPVN